MPTYLLLVACLFICNSTAVDIGDFSNNLASDLGPLLSLFGDSMTKQFLGESMTYLDYIIFAVAPIGIITTLVSTIRLCGSTALRAFIGRSQEGQGAVEAELCTSTSRDVCELFTRGGIQRVLGRPSILELVYTPGNSQESSRGVSKSSPVLNLSRFYFTNTARLTNLPWKKISSADVGQKDKGRRPSLAPNPNLSLNVGIRRPPDWIFWSIAIIGITLQIGVLALAGVGVWMLGWDLSNGRGSARDYAPIMFIVGTTLLCVGMWGCAFLIGQTTQEVRFQRKAISDREPRLLWIQPGPQVVGDQSFDPFAYLDEKNLINVWSSSRKLLNREFEVYTYAAVVATLTGYIIQFIGIRGMEAWVSLAQLGVTILMSILRGMLRTRRLGDEDNHLRLMPDMVAGHELDWLAYRLATNDDNAGWHVTAQHKRGVEKAEEAGDPMPFIDDTDIGLLSVRTQLANLTGLFAVQQRNSGQYRPWQDEHVKVRKKARQLSLVFSNVLLSDVDTGTERARDIDLQVFTSTLNNWVKRAQPISLKLRARPEVSQEGWRLDTDKLEAVLGLWLWTILQDDTIRRGEQLSAEKPKDDRVKQSLADQTRTVRFVFFALEKEDWFHGNNIQDEMDLWLGRGSVEFRQGTIDLHLQEAYGLATTFYENNVKNNTCKRAAPERGILTWPKQRFSGWNYAHQAIEAEVNRSTPSISQSDDEHEHESPAIKNPYQKFRFQGAQLPLIDVSLLDLCCQELFVAMMMSLIEHGAGLMLQATIVGSGNTLRLQHPVVNSFATAFVDAGLGTYTDAILCIVPAIRAKLPAISSITILPTLEAAAEMYRRESQWRKAETLLRFGCTCSEKPGNPPLHLGRSIRTLCELYRWALSKFTDTERTFALDGINKVVGMFAEACKTKPHISDIIDRYKSLALRFTESEAEEKNGNTTLGPARVTRYSPPEAISKKLLEAIQGGDHKEALYQLCLITPYCEVKGVIPASALTLAVRNNWIEVASVLLQLEDAGIDSNQAIYDFADLGHKACARIMRDYDECFALAEAQDRPRLTLLHDAIRDANLRLVKLLLDVGFPGRDETDHEGLTPLIRAVKMDLKEGVELFLDGGANIEALDREGQTALFHALGSRKMLNYLIERHANLEAKNNIGETVIMVAHKHQNTAAVRLLRERGVKGDVLGGKGRFRKSMIGVLGSV
jgi:hypothetical protein